MVGPCIGLLVSWGFPRMEKRKEKALQAQRLQKKMHKTKERQQAQKATWPRKRDLKRKRQAKTRQRPSRTKSNAFHHLRLKAKRWRQLSLPSTFNLARRGLKQSRSNCKGKGMQTRLMFTSREGPWHTSTTLPFHAVPQRQLPTCWGRLAKKSLFQ